MEKTGSTPLVPFLQAKEYGLDVVIKDESRNPTGTYKDRRSDLIVRKAMEERINKLVLISAGNAAYSLAHYAQPEGIEVVTVLDYSTHQSIKNTLRSVCWKVIELDLGREFLSDEKLIAIARDFVDEKIWNVTNGFHDAYRSIVEELPSEPDTIVVPFGSGEAATGIYAQVLEQGWRTNVWGVESCYNPKLKTRFHPYRSAYLNKVMFSKDEDREEILFVAPEGAGCFSTMQCVTPRQEREMVESVNCPVEAEDAGRYALGALPTLLDCVRDFGKNIVVINSGKGRVIETDEANFL